MKKFLVQAFQQKYNLPSKLREKTAVWKNFPKSGKPLNVIKLVKKGNKRKQNHHLISNHKFLISFVSNLIWKKISSPLVELLTPSIVKSNQLSKITDFRNHHGFCQETEALRKARGESLLSDTVLNSLNKSGKLIEECTIDNFELSSAHKTLRNTAAENSDKNCLKCDLESPKLTNESKESQSTLVKSSCLRGTKEKTRERFISVDINNNDLKSQSLKTTDDMEKRTYEDKQYKTSKRTEGSIRRRKNVRNRKTSNSSISDIQSNTCVESSKTEPSPILKSEKIKSLNKQSNVTYYKQRNILNGARIEKLTVLDKVAPKLGDSIENCLDESYKTNNKTDLSLNKEAKLMGGIEGNEIGDQQVDSLGQKKMFIKAVEIEQTENNLPTNKSSSTKTNKISNIKGHTKTILETEQKVNNEMENSNKPDQSLYLEHQSNNSNKSLQSQSSKKKKKKKRKNHSEKKLNKLTSKAEEEYYRKDKKDRMIINKGKVGVSSFEEIKPQSTFKFEFDRENNIEQNPALLSYEDKDPHCTNSTDFPKKTPQIVKSNLVIFDTSQDEARLLVREQSVGESNVKCDLIDLNAVITKENSSNTVQSKPKPQVSASKDKNVGSENKLTSGNSVHNKCKTTSVKPWKRKKETSVGTRNTPNNESTYNMNINKNSIYTASQKHSHKPESKEKDQLKRFSIKEPTFLSEMSSDIEITNKPAIKVLSVNKDNDRQNKQENMSPKKSSVKVDSPSPHLQMPLKTINQNAQTSDDIHSQSNCFARDQTSLKGQGNRNKLNEEARPEHMPQLNLKTSKPLSKADYEMKTNINTENEGGSNNMKVISDNRKTSDRTKNQRTGELKINVEKSKVLEHQNEPRRGVKNEFSELEIKENNSKTTFNTTRSITELDFSGGNELSQKKEKALQTSSRIQNVEQTQGSIKQNIKSNIVQKKVSETVSDSNKVIKSSIKNSNKMKIKRNNIITDEGGKAKNTYEEQANNGKDNNKSISSPVNRNNNEKKDRFESQVSINTKPSSKLNNKTSLEYKPDQLLSKAVADISQGVNEILGKEQFKSKMNNVLNNFTITGQKPQETNQRRIKSQEIIISGHKEREKKLMKPISQESVIKEKIKEVNSIKIKSQESLNHRISLSKDKNTTQSSTVMYEKISQESNTLGKTNTKPTASVRPALIKPKNTKNVQHQTVAKIKVVTNIIPSSKVKTVATNAPEKNNSNNNSLSSGIKQNMAVNNTLKNEAAKATVGSIKPNNDGEKLSTKTELVKKLEKRRPSE